MKIGSIEVLPVLDGKIISKRPSSKPLPEPGSSVWLDQGGMFLDDGMKESTLGGFLIRSGDRLILVDAGGGQAHPGGYSSPSVDPDHLDGPYLEFFNSRNLTPDQIRQFASDIGRTRIQQGDLPKSMATLGVAREEITDVVFTHLHWDHIGWVSEGGEPYFPNAAVHCASDDLDYFMAGPEEDWFSAQVFQTLTVGDRLSPVLGRIETWERDSPLLPGLDVRLTPGHTPGSTVVVVSSGDERAMLLGDVVHCPLELMDDDFNLLGDHDQRLADQVRESLARELEGTRVHVAAAHFPGLKFGRLLPGQGIRRWTFHKDGNN